MRNTDDAWQGPDYDGPRRAGSLAAMIENLGQGRSRDDGSLPAATADDCGQGFGDDGGLNDSH